jgi:NADH dehydrogenase
MVLSHMPPDLAASATQQLLNLGVRVCTSTRVKSIRRARVELDTGEVIAAENIIWAAGVSASPITRDLGVELDRAGRVMVHPDLSIPGHPEAFAIGDLAFVPQADGPPVPGVSPAAMQMARHVARVIRDELAAPGPGHAVRGPFRYWDKGTMATIGRSSAVAFTGPFHLTGVLAWLAWLFVHLIFLIGFRNKVAVLLQWIYSYFSYKRGARIITHLPDKPATASVATSSTRATPAPPPLSDGLPKRD